MKNYKQIKSKLLKDPKIKKAYDDLKPEFDLIVQNIKKQNSKKLNTNTTPQKHLIT
ncbi:MAG: hypothetical protein ABIJ23_00930 [Candidatus Magasanikbacteria bacterium]